MADPTPTPPTPIPKVPVSVWLSAIASCVVLVIGGLVHETPEVWGAGLAGLAGLGIVPRR